MKRPTTLVAALAVTLLATAAVSAAPVDAFATVVEPYEAVRLALVADDLGAVSAPAAQLAEAVDHLGHHLDAASAGVPHEKLEEVRGLLPELAAAAAGLAVAENLGAAREAFYALSKPLVRWRQAAGTGPEVVYCPMKKRSWLQPAGEKVGNPYYGQEMTSCGNVVAK